MEQIIADIRAGLRALGYGHGVAYRRADGRFSVIVDGEHVGIWDADKRTFID